MKRSILIRLSALLLALTLTGCSTTTTPPVSDDDITPPSQETSASPTPSETTETPPPSDTTTPEMTPPETTTPPEETTTPTEPPVVTQPEPETDEYGLTEQQRNSFSMLYYLAITAEEIRISNDNRLILDDIYTSLLNDINPGAIDETTQDHLQSLRDTIKKYIEISYKREQLQYIYNQDKASAIHSAVPDPLAVLSMANSFNWKKLAVSTVYTVVDSYSNYKSATTAADQAFLTSGWELDKEERDAIYKNRERAFDYMVDIVQEYDLNGLLTLNEKAIGSFAEICAIQYVHEKIQRLVAEEETYVLLGNYWIELADCYYETSQYEKCLECVEKYNELAMGIYRKDFNYVQILPKAIVAAQETYSGDEYTSNVKTFADAIMSNTTTEEWSIRYFAAQVYLDLYSRTNDRTYLEAAYNIAKNNVTILLDEQRALNATYLAAVEEVTLEEPDYRFMTEDEKKSAEQEYKDEQKRLKAYNKSLKETRKTELSTLYEPLVLNCDLLFALAAEMNISKSEKQEIEAILQTDTNGVFLSKPVNDRYSFATITADYHIDFSKDEIVIPANLLTAEAKITVKVNDGGKTTVFDDCIVTKVERDGDEIESFVAHISSEQMEDYKWTESSRVTVEISYGDNYDAITFNFKVKEYKVNWWLIPDKVVFEEE